MAKDEVRRLDAQRVKVAESCIVYLASCVRMLVPDGAGAEVVCGVGQPPVITCLFFAVAADLFFGTSARFSKHCNIITFRAHLLPILDATAARSAVTFAKDGFDGASKVFDASFEALAEPSRRTLLKSSELFPWQSW